MMNSNGSRSTKSKKSRKPGPSSKQAAGRNKNGKKKRLLVVLAVVVLAAIVVATVLASGSCNKDSEPVETTTTASETTTPTSTEAPTTQTTMAETTPEPENINQLTGLPLEEGQTPGTRPVAIMISNIKVATPQIGVDQADLLFEMEVEAGITRMMAMFADVQTIPEIGSIRSARHNYIDLSGAFDAILVHMGGSSVAVDQLRRQETENYDGQIHFDAFWRDAAWRSQRGYEHSVKTTGENLTAGIARLGLRSEVDPAYASPFSFQPFGEFASDGDLSATYVRVPFSSYVTTELHYDSDQKSYLKSQFGQPQIDLITGETFSYTNVLILQTTITKMPGNVLSDINLSSGNGYYVSGGKAREIQWEKGDTADRFQFIDNDGNEVVMNRGKTYIAIVSNRQTISFDS